MPGMMRWLCLSYSVTARSLPSPPLPARKKSSSRLSRNPAAVSVATACANLFRLRMAIRATCAAPCTGSIEKDVEHAERPGCRTATVEIHRNVFCIVDSRKERFSLFKRCGEGRQTGCVLAMREAFSSATPIACIPLLRAAYESHTPARSLRCVAFSSSPIRPCGMQRNV